MVVTSLVLLDEEGNAIEDPVSLRPIPTEYAVLLDQQYYDIRMLARVLHRGYPYVPHNRRVFTSQERAFIRSQSHYERPPSSCGAYRRGRGAFQNLYNRAVVIENTGAVWKPACMAIRAYQDNFMTPDILHDLERIVDPDSVESRTIYGILGATKTRDVFERIHGALVSSSESVWSRGIIRLHADRLLDIYLLYAYEYDYSYD
jgi:hypothetical protein